jgi:hypothetical protein
VQVLNLTAEPNPGGGRIDLSWTNPDFPGFKGVKILRREGTYPVIPADLGTAKQIHDDASTLAGQVGQFSDTGLKSETVYYYAVVAYDAASNHFPIFTSVMATTAYGTGASLYSDLPALYQRYDTIKPPDVPGLDPAERDKGQLLRLVEMFGLQFDLLRSFASGMQNFYDLTQIDGTLLPLLAEWIGWQTNFTLPLDKQRNEIAYAPHYYRTTGIAANLRATVNRLTRWDAQFKEFVHNVFLSNDPEQLTIWETERQDGTILPAKLVTLDVAYEGKPAVVQAQDGRTFLFYHARETTPPPRGTVAAAEDHWHLWYKIHDEDEWLAARRLTLEDRINKYPAAVQRSDGNVWVFWTAYSKTGGKPIPQIRLNLMAAGRAARPARVHGSRKEPFAFADGDEFKIDLQDGATTTSITVRFHPEDFQNIGQATAAEVSAILNRELPGVQVTAADDGSIVLTSDAAGAASSLTFPASSIASELGLAGAVTGRDASSAQLMGSLHEPFSLADEDGLWIRVDGDLFRLVRFRTEQFQNIAQATATEIVAVINRVLPGAAKNESGQIKLTSPTAGASSLVVVDVGASTAAPKLGFGAPLPPALPATEETEPAAFEDGAGQVWLFWSSRRTGRWNIWYNRCDGTSWGTAKPLTAGPEADREPSVVVDPAGGGKIWAFWSRQKANGLWNIFYRITKKLDFNTHVDSDWTALSELSPVPADYDNKEPAALLTDTDKIDLYFSSNREDEWNLWSKPITPASQGADAQITTGQFTQRAAAVLKVSSQRTRLYFRANISQDYVSSVYTGIKTVDARYSGSTTVDLQNSAKMARRGDIQDLQRYTYDTGKEEMNWYARDTIGIFLTADTNDPEIIKRTKLLIEGGLKKFLPIQVRAVLIIQSNPGFHALFTWKAGPPPGVLPDLSVTPPDLSFRLFVKGVEV